MPGLRAVKVDESRREIDKTLGLRERNKQNKVARIHSAARALFEEQGYDSTTIREIARRADVGVGTVFLYARDKTELLFLIFKDELHEVFDAASARVNDDAPVVDQLMAYFTPILKALAPNGALARIMVREAFRLSGNAARDMNVLRAKINGHLKRIIATTQRRGDMRKDLTDDALVDALWANFRFYADDWLGGPDPKLSVGVKKLKTGLVILLQGIGTR